MSATTELITEQIIKLKDRIDAARKTGSDITSLVEEHDVLMKRLSAASQALNENKQILKG